MRYYSAKMALAPAPSVPLPEWPSFRFFFSSVLLLPLLGQAPAARCRPRPGSRPPRAGPCAARAGTGSAHQGRPSAAHGRRAGGRRLQRRENPQAAWQRQLSAGRRVSVLRLGLPIPRQNEVEAFSNVRVVQSDTMTITGDHGFYDGDQRTARMTGNVVMRDPRMTLTTPSARLRPEPQNGLLHRNRPPHRPAKHPRQPAGLLRYQLQGLRLQAQRAPRHARFGAEQRHAALQHRQQNCLLQRPHAHQGQAGQPLRRGRQLQHHYPGFQLQEKRQNRHAQLPAGRRPAGV